MKIEIARHERMSETGSSLVRLLQNHDMPVLDLLVREAVQNSLDAALDGPGAVEVNFFIRTFETSQVIKHLEGIQDGLAARYPEREYRLMEIRDSNTHGLTGPLHESQCTPEHYGNLIKLIYQIGMPQQKAGSGGSWGLGKTVYFRLGAGIVFYYSRICEDGIYKSRFAACMVEDETKADALLKNLGSNRGIAWWGQLAANGSTMPLTDEFVIHEILNDLGARPFTGTQTGTAVIIPFLRNDLRPEIEGGDSENTGYQPPWNSSDEEYISVALQRWYAPRLMNPKYVHGKWLKAAVNGQLISVDQFLPVFKIIHDLYNYGLAHMTNSEPPAVPDIYCESIRLRNVLHSSEAGWISFGKFSRTDLRMGPPDNFPSPWVQILGRELPQDTNPPVVAYTRKPGMIVGYEYTGRWVDGIPKSDKDHYVIGIFIANSNNRLVEEHPRLPGQPFLLEEYLRGCEKADHTSWTDWIPNKKYLDIVHRIQSNLSRRMSGILSPKQEVKEMQKDAVLGRMLAKFLLPPEGFGRGPSPSKKLPGGPGRTGVNGTYARFVSLSSPRYDDDLLCIDFELFTGKANSPIMISLAVQTESGDIEGNEWESGDGVGTPFPVSIKKAVFSSIANAKSQSNELSDKLELVNPAVPAKSLGYVFRGITSSTFNRFCGIEIEGAVNKVIKGSIWIKPEDRGVRLAIKVDALRGVANA